MFTKIIILLLSLIFITNYYTNLIKSIVNQASEQNIKMLININSWSVKFSKKVVINGVSRNINKKTKLQFCSKLKKKK